jgi:hypothetical protein
MIGYITMMPAVEKNPIAPWPKINPGIAIKV